MVGAQNLISPLRQKVHSDGENLDCHYQSYKNGNHWSVNPYRIFVTKAINQSGKKKHKRCHVG